MKKRAPRGPPADFWKNRQPLMAPENKDDNKSKRIAITFEDADDDDSAAVVEKLEANAAADDSQELANTMTSETEATASEQEAIEPEHVQVETEPPAEIPAAEVAAVGGPEVAELVASRAELKRLESEVRELRDGLARRQADFENYRKRMERERSETYNRVVADIAAKLLPVLDNLKRALETEASVEASESDEFRHFLSGVDLIYKQLNGVLDALGVKPILAEGQVFNPHLHEAVVTEATDEFEADTVMQEIVRGFRIGEKLIRPSLVKVAVKK